MSITKTDNQNALYVFWTFSLCGILYLQSTLETRGDATEELIKQLESVSSANIRGYQLKSNQGRGMDCLKVFQPEGAGFRGQYFGVYHHLHEGVFSIHLAKSDNLLNWQDITSLDEHASQATIFPCKEGRFLLACEKDAPNSCWIRLRDYENLAHLLGGAHSREVDLPRSIAPTAEGTPSFESVKIGKKGIDQSEIQLRFHYFKKVRVDQLAAGTLTDFKHWQATPSEAINKAFIEKGWNGNLGDRDSFMWGDKHFYLQETQKKRGDWSSWRINLCDERGMPIQTLDFKTDSHSKAFANPNATWVFDSTGQKKLIITSFLPSEGNSAKEAGTLLYAITPSLNSN